LEVEVEAAAVPAVEEEAVVVAAVRIHSPVFPTPRSPPPPTHPFTPI